MSTSNPNIELISTSTQTWRKEVRSVSKLLLNINNRRRRLIISNPSDKDIYIAFDLRCTLTRHSFLLFAGATYFMDYAYTGYISALSPTSTTTPYPALMITEFN